MRVKTENEGRTKDVAIVDVTPDNYICPANEKHMYHAVIEVRKFDTNSGERSSIPRIQKFGKKSFENSVRDNLLKQGNTITILHDPSDYLKEKAEAKKEAIAQKIAAEEEARKKAEDKAAEDQQKAIDAAVEKALSKQAKAHEKEVAKAVSDALKGKKTESKAEDKAAEEKAEK